MIAGLSVVGLHLIKSWTTALLSWTSFTLNFVIRNSHRRSALSRMQRFLRMIVAEGGVDAALVQSYGSLNVGSGSRRARSSSIPARPYICRFSILSRLSCPSTGPLLHGLLTAASTALRSCFKVRTMRTSEWIPVMPEHQEQQATVAHLVPAVPSTVQPRAR